MEMEDSNVHYLKFTAGQLLSFESGCYSDRHSLGVYRVIKDGADLRELAEAFLSTIEEDERNYVDVDTFVPYLEREGVLEYVAHRSIHLGESGELDPS